MTPAPDRFPSGSRGSTWLGAIILAVVLAAAVTAALAVGAGRPDWPEAVALAATIAGVSGIGGWIVGRRPAANPAAAVGAALLATVLRILPPLATLAWLATWGVRLRTAGADGLVAVLYLIMLATTIALHVMWRSGGRQAGDATGAN